MAAQFPAPAEHRYPMSLPIQMLWVEGPLSPLERLAIRSFLQCGHPVHLYIYGDVIGIPAGVTVMDGRSVLPEDRICRYGPAAGPGAGSLALFANFFRYALLEQSGGIWSDTDVVCLRNLDAAMNGDYVFATEYRDRSRQILLANNCLFKVPAGSPFIAECNAIARTAKPDSVRWGELGPSLLTAMIRRHALERSLVPPHVFCPLGWWQVPRFVDDTPLDFDEATLTLHCFNEMWRRSKLDKNAAYGSRSPFETLKRRFGVDDRESGFGHAGGTGVPR
jgi:hypothetical protein